MVLPDPNRPWNNSECPDCKEFCAGHYMEPRLALSHLSSPGAVPCSRPLCVIEQALYKSGNMIQEDLAKKILIPISEVDIWL